jgi:hypothetical protein
VEGAENEEPTSAVCQDGEVLLDEDEGGNGGLVDCRAAETVLDPQGVHLSKKSLNYNKNDIQECSSVFELMSINEMGFGDGT